MTRAIQLTLSGRLAIRERDIQRQVCDYLRAHGWYVLRLNVFRGRLEQGGWIEQGEVGMADVLAMRSWCWDNFFMNPMMELCRVLFLEIKTPRGRLSVAQSNWHAWARKQGFRVETIRSLEELVDVLR